MNTQDRPILAPAPRTDDIQIAGRDPIPVTLLTGFLRSGKTTLLNRILSGSHGLRVGVLVNDFGAINIDAELVEGVEENTINLSNGCICCEIRDDLVQSLEELLLRAEQIDYVIVEASGVSDPEGIVMTFLDRRYEKLLYLDSITCIIDAEAKGPLRPPHRRHRQVHLKIGHWIPRIVELSLVGLHFGTVTLGDIGSARRLEFTVIGDTVNVASRLEAASRELDCNCVVSDELMKRTGENASVGNLKSTFEPRSGVRLRGRQSTIDVWTA